MTQSLKKISISHVVLIIAIIFLCMSIFFYAISSPIVWLGISFIFPLTNNSITEKISFIGFGCTIIFAMIAFIIGYKEKKSNE